MAGAPAGGCSVGETLVPPCRTGTCCCVWWQGEGFLGSPLKKSAPVRVFVDFLDDAFCGFSR